MNGPTSPRETTMKKARERYGKMNAAELAAATAKYDRPFGGWDEFKPITASDRRMHQQARRRGRPKIGDGAKRVMITVEMGLLKAADDYARRSGMSRSELVANGIRSILPKAS
jgi:hypothetical protein